MRAGQTRPLETYRVTVRDLFDRSRVVGEVLVECRYARQAADEVAADYWQDGDVVAVNVNDPDDRFDMVRDPDATDRRAIK